jgi:hypothetical protein
MRSKRPSRPGIATPSSFLSVSHPLRPYVRLHAPRTSSLDSSSRPDRHIDRRRDRLQRRPFAAGDTCPDPVVGVLAGSTCPAVGLVDRIALVVVRSPGLVAGMGWASRIG